MNNYHLSQGERDAVAEGIEQLDTGLFLSNEEANRLVDIWLRKVLLVRPD